MTNFDADKSLSARTHDFDAEQIVVSDFVRALIDFTPEPPSLKSQDRRELSKKMPNIQLRLWLWHRALVRNRGLRRRAITVFVGCARLGAWEGRDRAQARSIKEELANATEDDLITINDATRRAFQVLQPCTGRTEVLRFYQLGAATAQRESAENKLTHSSRVRQFRVACHELLRDASLYQLEALARRLPPLWFCEGCDEWHEQVKGAPPRHLSALTLMMDRAIRAEGVRPGQGKQIYHSMSGQIDGPMPSKSRWYKFIKEHHLDRVGERKRVVYRDRDGDWALWLWKRPTQALVD